MPSQTMIAIVAALLAVVPARAQDAVATDDALVAAQRELADKWAKVKTLAAESQITNHQKYEGGNTTVESKGTFELAKKDDKVYLYWDIKSETTIRKDGEEEQKRFSRTLTVTDGNHTWGMTERDGVTKVRKTRIQPVYHLDVNALFESLKARGPAREMPADKVDGVPVRGFIADLKEGENLIGNVVYYFATDTGVLMRTVTAGASGSVTTQLNNVRLNVAIPQDRFTFVVPEDAEFKDLSVP